VNKLVVLHSIYLFYVLVALSWAALRTSVVLRRAARADATQARGTSRERILASTLVSLAILFGMSWWVADLSEIRLFAVPALGARELVASLVALAAHFALRRIAIAMHTREELRTSPLLAWMPRTRREWTLWVPVAIGAGLAEEAAYRGVAWTLLARYTGNVWVAAAICIVAFGVAHITQKWKSVVIILAIAAVMHAFVAFTGTLVLAMIVHAVYDLAVAVLIGRRTARLERESASTDPVRAPAARR
jgi:membrane protease YdiL (CAAX protease family)